MSHPVGNIKIKIIKFSAEYLNKFLIFFLSFFIKIDKKKVRDYYFQCYFGTLEI